jgi:hypothetical protein
MHNIENVNTAYLKLDVSFVQMYFAANGRHTLLISVVNSLKKFPASLAGKIGLRTKLFLLYTIFTLI